MELGVATTQAPHVGDEDVRRAFDAQPELRGPAHVAYFTRDEEHVEEIERMLSHVAHVRSFYRLPLVLVSGRQRFEDGPVTIDVEQLRLLAARARADLVLIFDYGYRTEYSANGLAALGVAVVPLFFLPMQDVDAESYLDSYLFDTKSGFFYGQLHATRHAGEGFLTIYSSAGDDLVEAQRAEMLAETQKSLGSLLATHLEAAAKRPAAPGRTEPPLPTDTEDPWAAPKQLTVMIERDGGVVADGERFASTEALADRVRLRLARGPIAAVVAADQQAPFARVAEVMDLLKRAGVAKVSLAVAGPQDAPPKEGPPPTKETPPPPRKDAPPPVKEAPKPRSTVTEPGF
jgi:biopolymer transport protein ExbD